MFWIIQQLFIGLLCFSPSLSSIVNTPDHVKYISLNNQQYMTQPTQPTYILVNTLKDYVTIQMQLI